MITFSQGGAAKSILSSFQNLDTRLIVSELHLGKKNPILGRETVSIFRFSAEDFESDFKTA